MILCCITKSGSTTLLGILSFFSYSVRKIWNERVWVSTVHDALRDVVILVGHARPPVGGLPTPFFF
jgi:hypothetical protein